MADDHPIRHDAAFDASRVDRDRTLAAIHDLETAAAHAAQPSGWLTAVQRDLEALESALTEEDRQSLEPDGLLSLIAAEDRRRFGGKVRRLREQRTDILRQVTSLRSQLGDHTETDPLDLRHRIAWVVRALHHYRAMETDLVYDAIERDLGAS